MLETLSPQHLDTIAQHIGRAEGYQSNRHPVQISTKPILLQTGRRRSIFKVTTNQDKTYVISINKPGYPAPKGMHELHQELYDKGVPVVRPVGDMGHLTVAGETQNAQFVVGEFIEGTPVRTAQDMEAFGRALAQLHDQSDDYFTLHKTEPNHAGASWRIAGRMLGGARIAEDHEIKRYLQNGTPPDKRIIHAAKELRQMAYDMPDHHFRSGLGHKDAHGENVIIREDGQAILIDMELCGEWIPADDMAMAILFGGIDFMGSKEEQSASIYINNKKVDAFFKGYEEVQSLSPKEKQSVFTLVKSLAKNYEAHANLNDFSVDDFKQWSEKVGSWTDRVKASSNEYTGKLL